MDLIIKQQLHDFGASDQAAKKLGTYADLIRQWQKAINLVSPTTLPDLWQRHIVDSAQLWPILQNVSRGTSVLDLGSGGGLPGLVLAAMGADHVTMVESDKRKCIFLQESARAMGLANVTVVNKRIEQYDGPKARLVTARALASLEKLVEDALPLIEDDAFLVFPKGENWQAELAQVESNKDWSFITWQSFASVTDKAARILVGRVSRGT